MTPARLRALQVLDQFGTARYSNVTTDMAHRVIGATPCIYWQSANWLIEQGFARLEGVDRLHITSAGHVALIEEEAKG